MEDLEKVNVVLLLTEVLLEEEVDSRLEHERVVDGDVADVLLQTMDHQDVSALRSIELYSENVTTHHFVPARLTATGDGLIHHVVGDEEVGLKLYSSNTFQNTSISCLPL